MNQLSDKDIEECAVDYALHVVLGPERSLVQLIPKPPARPLIVYGCKVML